MQRPNLCPHCGGRMIFRYAVPKEENPEGYIDWCRLECESCGSYTPKWYAGENEAIRAWKLIPELQQAAPEPTLSALKPCPNCGCEGKLTPYINKWDGQQYGYYVECETCGARTYVCACETPAVDDWNTGYLIVRG